VLLKKCFPGTHPQPLERPVSACVWICTDRTGPIDEANCLSVSSVVGHARLPTNTTFVPAASPSRHNKGGQTTRRDGPKRQAPAQPRFLPAILSPLAADSLLGVVRGVGKGHRVRRGAVLTLGVGFSGSPAPLLVQG
jgi:hypothetical protein